MMVKSGGEEAFKKEFEEAIAKSRETQNPIEDAKITFFKKKMRNAKKIEYEEPLFKGYVFMSTEKLTVQQVNAAKKRKNFYHFLDSNANIQKLCPKDYEQIAALLQFGEIQGVSKAYFNEKQRIVVTSGPLAGFEGKITKVNRKRGRATVQIDLCSNIMKFDLAFDEITQLPDTCKS